MQLKCSVCKSNILSDDSDDINIDSSIVKCHSCFEVGDKLNNAQPLSSDYVKSNVEMPKCFSVDKSGRELIITKRWFTLAVFPFLFVCILFDLGGFPVVIKEVTANVPLIFKLIRLICYVGVAVCFHYIVLVGLLNKTFIKVIYPNISVEHSPIPWPGNKVIRTSEIDQLFCEEIVSRSRRTGNISYTYTVGIILKGGKRDELVAGLEPPEQARFIEQEIERFLGIKDRSVAGEMRPV